MKRDLFEKRTKAISMIYFVLLINTKTTTRMWFNKEELEKDGLSFSFSLTHIAIVTKQDKK